MQLISLTPGKIAHPDRSEDWMLSPGLAKVSSIRLAGSGPRFSRVKVKGISNPSRGAFGADIVRRRSAFAFVTLSCAVALWLPVFT